MSLTEKRLNEIYKIIEKNVNDIVGYLNSGLVPEKNNSLEVYFKSMNLKFPSRLYARFVAHYKELLIKENNVKGLFSKMKKRSIQLKRNKLVIKFTLDIQQLISVALISGIFKP